MPSNKSLERTVVHFGRTVRAFTVGARAGAEQQSWLVLAVDAFPRGPENGRSVIDTRA